MQKQTIIFNRNKSEDAKKAQTKLIADIEQEKIEHKKVFEKKHGDWDKLLDKEKHPEPVFLELPIIAHEISVELDCECGEVCGSITFPHSKDIDVVIAHRNIHTVTCDKCLLKKVEEEKENNK